MVENNPIVARIVIDDSATSGLGGGKGGSASAGSNGETNKQLASTNRLLQLLVTEEALGLGKLGQVLGGIAGLGITVAEAVTAGLISSGIAEVITAVVDALAGGVGDPNSTDYMPPTTSEDEALGTSEALNIELADVQEQILGDTKGQATITANTRTTSEKIGEYLQKQENILGDDLQKELDKFLTNMANINTATSNVAESYNEMNERIKNNRTGGYITGSGSFTSSYSEASADAASGGEGQSIGVPTVPKFESFATNLQSSSEVRQ